jgi:hypothetical protein
MIQTTAPMPGPTGVSPLQAIAAPVAGDFAALLQTTQSADAAMPSPAPLSPVTIAAGMPMPITLPDVVKGASDGLAALVRQADAAVPRQPNGAGLTVITPPIEPAAQAVCELPHAAFAAAFVQGPGDNAPPAAVPTTRFAPMAEPGEAEPAPAPDLHHERPAAFPTATPLPGKHGKPGGKILPPAGQPTTTEQGPPPRATADRTSIAQTAPDQPGATVPALLEITAPAPQAAPLVAQPIATAIASLAATATASPAAFARVAARPASHPAAPAAVPASRQPDMIAQKASLPIAAPVGAVQLESTEIAAARTIAPITPVPIPATGQPARPAAPAAADAAPSLPIRGGTSIASAAPALDARPVMAAPTMPSDAVVQATPPSPRAFAIASDRPAAPPALPTPDLAPITEHPAIDTPRPNPAARPAVPTPGEGTATKPLEAETAQPRPPERQPSLQPLLADAMPAAPPTPASDAAAATVSVEAPQDFDTLVSRLAEAREMAAPHVVRTALAHGEFGRVSMQIGQQDGGLSVTLASRDPEFTGAVQAAAASLAGQAATSGEQPRPDQQNGHARQEQTSAQSGANSGQGQNQRTDASGQQARRESGGSAQPHERRQSDRPAPGNGGRGGQRASDGVYA